MRLLLLSNSTNSGRGYLDHAEAAIRSLLGGTRRLLFVPFALKDLEGYTRKAGERFAAWGVELEGLRGDAADPERLARAEAVFVGGGNTFRLLDTLQRHDLVEPLRERVRAGLPYLGASAGTNVATPSLRTTNDMPIVEPASFAALRLVPFQINPHFVDADPASRHMGETREERLREYLEENAAPVVGLREGAWLVREGDRLRLGGPTGARLFRRGAPPEALAPGSQLDALLLEGAE